MIWSVCAVVNEDGRKKIDAFLRSSEKTFPIADTVYHYYVDMNTSQFRHWENLLEDNQWAYDAEYKLQFVLLYLLNTHVHLCFQITFFQNNCTYN